jgi:hypothetical protein
MATTRKRELTLLPTLQDAFINPTLKASCLASSKEQLQKGTNNNSGYRAFDTFPPLLPQTELDALMNEIRIILQHIQYNIKNNKGFYLLTLDNQNAIAHLQKRVIKIACDELLNTDGKIKSEIINLLEWDSIKSNIHIDDIIGSYTNMVLHNPLYLGTLSENEKNALNSFYLYSTAHSGEWIDEQLTSIWQRAANKLVATAKEQPLATASIAGLTLFGIVTIIGLTTSTLKASPR